MDQDLDGAEVRDGGLVRAPGQAAVSAVGDGGAGGHITREAAGVRLAVIFHGDAGETDGDLRGLNREGARGRSDHVVPLLLRSRYSDGIAAGVIGGGIIGLAGEGIGDQRRIFALYKAGNRGREHGNLAAVGHDQVVRRDGNDPRLNTERGGGGDGLKVRVRGTDGDFHRAGIADRGRFGAPGGAAVGAVFHSGTVGDVHGGGDKVLKAVIGAGVARGGDGEFAGAGNGEGAVHDGDQVVPLDFSRGDGDRIAAHIFAALAPEFVFNMDFVCLALEDALDPGSERGIGVAVGLGEVVRADRDGERLHGESAFRCGGFVIAVLGPDKVRKFARVGEGREITAPAEAGIRAVRESGTVTGIGAVFGTAGERLGIIELHRAQGLKGHGGLPNGKGAGHGGDRVVPLVFVRSDGDEIGAGVHARGAGEAVGDAAQAVTLAEALDGNREHGLRLAVRDGFVLGPHGDGGRGDLQCAGDEGDGIGGSDIVLLGVKHGVRDSGKAPGIGAGIQPGGGHVALEVQGVARDQAGDGNAIGAAGERFGNRSALLLRSGVDGLQAVHREGEGRGRDGKGTEIFGGNLVVIRICRAVPGNDIGVRAAVGKELLARGGDGEGLTRHEAGDGGRGAAQRRAVIGLLGRTRSNRERSALHREGGGWGIGGDVARVLGLHKEGDGAGVGNGRGHGAPGFAIIQAVGDGGPLLHGKLRGGEVGSAVIGTAVARSGDGEPVGERNGEGAGHKGHVKVPLAGCAGGGDHIGADGFTRHTGELIGNFCRVTGDGLLNCRGEVRIRLSKELGGIGDGDRGRGRCDAEAARLIRDGVVPLLRIARGREGIGAHVFALGTGQGIGDEFRSVFALQHAGDLRRESGIFSAVDFGEAAGLHGD